MKFKLSLFWVLIFFISSTWSKPLLHDPTTPLYVEQKIPQKQLENLKYELQAIQIFPTNKYAVINSQNVQIGDTVNYAKVLEIDKDEVILLTPAGKKALHLFEDSTEEESP